MERGHPCPQSPAGAGSPVRAYAGKDARAPLNGRTREKAASSRRTPNSAQRDAPPRHLYPDQSLAAREKGLTLRIYSEKVYQ